MTYSSFLADAAAVRDRGDWLVELYLKNPAGSEEILRLSRRGTSTGTAVITVGADTVPANTRFAKRVLKAPVLTQALWRQSMLLGASLPSFGSLALSNADGGLDRYRPAEGYRWEGCRCKVFFCDTDNIQATIGKVFDGQLDKPRFGLKTPVEAPLRGREALFETKLSERVFRGSWHQIELFGDRTADYGTPAAVALTGSLTLESWIWLDALPTVGAAFWGWFTGTAKPWTLVVNSSGTFSVQSTVAGATETRTTVSAMVAQRQYHFALSISGATPTWYLWDESAQTLTTEVLTPFSSAARDALAGAVYRLRSASNATFRPWFDQMRVWNVARTAAEIASDRYRPFPAGQVPVACVHYAAMQDGTGTTITDRSATAANGTITGAGTSTWLPSMEGGPDMAGTPKQHVWGRNFGVPCVLVDPVRNAYAVGARSCSSIASFEGALAHTMAATPATYRDFLVTTPSAGQSLPYAARGLFRLSGTPPTLPVAATVLGYNGGPLGYVETTAGVMRDMVTRFGPNLADPADLDTASFTALGSATPAVIGMVLPEPVTMQEALDFAGSGAQAWWGYVRGSTLFGVARFTGPAGSADYAFDQRHILDVTDAPGSPVVYQVIVRYQRSRTVLTEDQVAASVKGTATWQRWTREWLETSPQTDEAIRAAYPGSASVSLTFDTPLYYEADAVALAASLLALLKGTHEGLQVVIRSPGFELTPGKTLTLGVTLQSGVIRMGFDGSRRYSLISIEDNKQDGTVTAEVWR